MRRSAGPSTARPWSRTCWWTPSARPRRRAVQPHRLRQDRHLHLRSGEGQGPAGRARRHRPHAEDHLGNRRVRRPTPPSWRPWWRCSAPSACKTELQQFEPGGNILAWRQGKQGDWDLLGNGFSSPTGLAITMMQGMYGGTAEKEKTRDTYQGYVGPGGAGQDPGRPPPRWTDPPAASCSPRHSRPSGTPGRAPGPSCPSPCWPTGAGRRPQPGPHQLLPAR